MFRPLPAAIATHPSEPLQGVVVLIHGLTRSCRSLSRLRKRLLEVGFGVVCLDYPSRSAPIAELAEAGMAAALQTSAEFHDAGDLHFVTHSLGGILVRQYLEHHPELKLGRMVMLGPPNQGSEVVDRLRRVPGFRWINGPAGLELGTDAESVPRRLGPVTGEVGVIAGVQSVNPLLSLLLPKPNDGKVSSASTRVAGMTDWVEVQTSHTLMTFDTRVINHTLTFLQQGSF